VSTTPDVWASGVPNMTLSADPVEGTTLTLSDSVQIDLKTGEVHLPPGVEISDAAKQFWDAISQMIPLRQCQENPR
jgi:hypothetical protein